MLIHGYTPKSIRTNVEREVSRGKSGKQAIAVSFEEARRAWRHAHPRGAYPAHLRGIRKGSRRLKGANRADRTHLRHTFGSLPVGGHFYPKNGANKNALLRKVSDTHYEHVRSGRGSGLTYAMRRDVLIDYEGNRSTTANRTGGGRSAARAAHILPKHLYEAHEWTSAAGELSELTRLRGAALTRYVRASTRNAREHGESISMQDLRELHDFLRRRDH